MTKLKTGPALAPWLMLAVALVPVCAHAQSASAQGDRAEPDWLGQPVTDNGLQSITGKADVHQNAVSALNGNVQGNTITGDVASGGVNFGQNALQGMTGVFIVNANTGNNVAINAALSVNVTITP